jgi:hypothetical protein
MARETMENKNSVIYFDHDDDVLKQALRNKAL